VGDCGELRVSIARANQVLPLRFAEDELDPGCFRSVVWYSLDRFGF